MSTHTPTDTAQMSEGQSAVKVPCLCTQMMNDALKRTCPGTRLVADMFSGRVMVAVFRAEGKGATPSLLATYCPFCGVKYED
jgi:hypothetical protein